MNCVSNKKINGNIDREKTWGYCLPHHSFFSHLDGQKNKIQLNGIEYLNFARVEGFHMQARPPAKIQGTINTNNAVIKLQ